MPTITDTSTSTTSTSSNTVATLARADWPSIGAELDTYGTAATADKDLAFMVAHSQNRNRLTSVESNQSPILIRSTSCPQLGSIAVSVTTAFICCESVAPGLSPKLRTGATPALGASAPISRPNWWT